jgi:hypothetical protein
MVQHRHGVLLNSKGASEQHYCSVAASSFALPDNHCPGSSTPGLLNDDAPVTPHMF